MVASNKLKLVKKLQHIILIALAIIWVFPMFYGILSSFKLEGDITANPPKIFIAHYSLINYERLLMRSPLFRWFVNTLGIAAITMAGVGIFSSLAGYAFSKMHFPGRDVLFYLMISMMFVPYFSLIVPLFRLVLSLKWYDNYLGLIIPQMALPFGVFLMKQFINSVPSEMIESAKIDGAKEWTIFLRIIVPLSSAALGALSIFAFVYSWNNFFWQLIVTKTNLLYTLPVGILYLQDDMTRRFGELLAGVTLSAVPMLIVFGSFQGTFVRGVTMGAIKG